MNNIVNIAFQKKLLGVNFHFNIKVFREWIGGHQKIVTFYIVNWVLLFQKIQFITTKSMSCNVQIFLSMDYFDVISISMDYFDVLLTIEAK